MDQIQILVAGKHEAEQVTILKAFRWNINEREVVRGTDRAPKLIRLKARRQLPPPEHARLHDIEREFRELSPKKRPGIVWPILILAYAVWGFIAGTLRGLNEEWELEVWLFGYAFLSVVLIVGTVFFIRVTVRRHQYDRDESSRVERRQLLLAAARGGPQI